MKIGIVSPYYMHIYGGVQTLISNLSAQLRSQGYDVTIIAPRPPTKKLPALETSEKVVILGNSINVNFKNPFHTTFPLAASNKEVIAEFLEKEQFDVLNIHEPWMPLLPYQVLQEASCPIVGTTHGRWPQSLLNKSLETIRAPYLRMVLQKLDVITAVSSVAALNVANLKTETKIQIIPNGIDLERYQQEASALRKPQKQPYILYLNRLEKRKGPRCLIKAYSAYLKNTNHPPLPLIIAGHGPQAKMLRNDVERLGLKDFVRFEGYVSKERKMELFSNAHLYVTPALYGESFGIVLLEAMATQTPFIAGDNEGYRVVSQQAGRLSLVDPRNSAKFARSLEAFCNDQELRARWLEWSDEAVQQYAYPNIVDQYAASFKKAIVQRQSLPN